MPEFRELVEKYRQRRRDTLVDAVTTGLSCVDELAVDMGLLADADPAVSVLDTVGVALPFAVIAVTEQMKVIMGRKDQKAGIQDAAFRMLKTGAAMAVGAAVGAVGLPVLASLPAAVSVRTLMDRYKSRSLTALRVQKRIERLQYLRQMNEQHAMNADFSGVLRLGEPAEE